MTSSPVILALDLGTTSNRCLAFSQTGQIVAQASQAFAQTYPHPGWVEQDPMALWEAARLVVSQVIQQVGAGAVVALGLTNQRETTIVWDRQTGQPIYPAIVWQCRRTADMCDQLHSHRLLIKEKTGLLLDPYFSATKLKWILESVPGANQRAKNGDLLFGTVDAWILWQLTGGRCHATDVSNASRTMLFNIRSMDYDAELLQLFDVPRCMLPTVLDSDAVFGHTDESIVGATIPIAAVLGDQQAALFAQCGDDVTQLKNTYGTGLFVVANTGPVISESDGLVSTVAWRRNGKVSYAVEGSIFTGGSLIQWLRDDLQLIQSAEETAHLALSLSGNDGVYLVPALTGLGAPHWQPNARAILVGLSRGSTRAHIVRSALESLAYQTCDVVKVLPGNYEALRVDGGASVNEFLMQFQADMLGMPVIRPKVNEITSLGVAGLVGISVGFWSEDVFRNQIEIEAVVSPKMSGEQRRELFDRWCQVMNGLKADLF